MGTLSLFDYDLIGFDLDHALARYKVQLIHSIYEIVADLLVARMKIPAEIMKKPMEDDKSYMIKGLILDVERGNLLQIDNESRIIRGTHGRKILSTQELEQIYGCNLKWNVVEEFMREPTDTWCGELDKKIRAFMDYFDICGAVAVTRAVEYLNEIGATNYADIYKYFKEAMRTTFVPEIEKSPLLTQIKCQPDNFYVQCSDDVINLLNKLKNSGKMLYLVTGSYPEFANMTAEYCLGKNWKNFFDIVIYIAKKPFFFKTADETFKDPLSGEVLDNDKICINGSYMNGNWKSVNKLFSKHSNISNPKNIYLGDNIVQDVYAPNKFALSDAVLICEEVNFEQDAKNKCEIDPDLKNLLSSNIWNPYLGHTMWQYFLDNHAVACVPSVEYLATGKNIYTLQ